MSRFKFRNIDDNEDYMAKRNEAAARGDYAAAEGYERDRNYKIDKLGLNYPKTYDYIDVGNEMKIGMENGISGADLMKMTDYRENKALTTPGLEKFAYDEIQDAAKRYYYNDLMGVGGNYQNKPVYENKYGEWVDKMWNRVMNREDFSYDMESDPNYQAYKEMYTREGNRAMQDTLAQVAQNAGGNNSYAVSAAAQANNYYMQQLADKVPELYDAAYNRYMNEENLARQDLELARMLESDDYNRYLGDMGVFQTNVGLANNLYNSQLDREYQERAWNYGVEQDDRNWDWLADETEYNRGQDAKAWEDKEQKDALNIAMTLIQSGDLPPDKILAAADLTADDWAAVAEMYKEGIERSKRHEELSNSILEEQLLANYGMGTGNSSVRIGGSRIISTPENYRNKVLAMTDYEILPSVQELVRAGIDRETAEELVANKDYQGMADAVDKLNEEQRQAEEAARKEAIMRQNASYGRNANTTEAALPETNAAETAPTEVTSAPAEPTPAPKEQTPASVETAPVPAPVQQTPAPAQSQPAPAKQTQTQAKQTQAPAKQTQTSAKQAMDTSDYRVANKNGDSWIMVDGIRGRISYQELQAGLVSGTIVETANHENRTIRYKKK